MSASLNVTDRKLLELAAKAAGWTAGFVISTAEPDVIITAMVDTGSKIFGRWNPLTDDGDALRLAVKLNLSIITGWGFDGNPSGSVGTMLGSHDDLRLTQVEHGDDPCAAWRRSIVIAAAEIGRSMP